jgi:hypothetical protein
MVSQKGGAQKQARTQMDAALKVKSISGGVSSWHAMTAEEVIKRLNSRHFV